jgi:hypothetical protein
VWAILWLILVSVLGAVVSFHLKPASRDRAIMIGGLLGFWAGSAVLSGRAGKPASLCSMKRLVRSDLFLGLCLGLGALVLVGIVQAEITISYVVMFSLIAVMAWQELVRRKAKRSRAHPDARRGL